MSKFLGTPDAPTRTGWIVGWVATFVIAFLLGFIPN